MAQVPYSPVPTEKPSGEGTRGISLQTPSAAFGGTIAQATEHLGGSIQKAGDELFKRALALQQVQNETSAREADTQYMIESGKLHANYNSLQGKSAVDALPQYQKDLKELRESIGGGLGNDATKKMYDAQTMPIMGRHIFNGAGHAATQQKVWTAGTSTANIDAAKEYSYHNPDDDRAFIDANLMAIRQIRDVQAPIAGWGPEQTSMQEKKVISDMWAHRIMGLSRTAPQRAQELLDANRPLLHGADIERVENNVQSAQRNTGARVIEQEINADLKTDPEGDKTPIQDRINQATEKAEVARPNDPVFIDEVRRRVTAGFDQSKKVYREQQRENEATVAEGVLGAQGAKLPTNIDELKATSPQVEVAYNNLTPQQKRKVNGWLSQNAKDDYPKTTEAFTKLQQLKGMAQNNPAEFAGANLMDEQLPREWKSQLMDLQRKVQKQAGGDPRVSRAIGWLKPMLTAAGMDSTRKEEYNLFVGNLQDAINTFQEENKKAPDFKQTQELGARLLQQVPGTGWFGSNVSNKKLFELQVPEDVSNAIKADPIWAEKGRTPTDEEIRRIFIRKRYEELYGKKDTK